MSAHEHAMHLAGVSACFFAIVLLLCHAMLSQHMSIPQQTSTQRVCAVAHSAACSTSTVMSRVCGNDEALGHVQHISMRLSLLADSARVLQHAMLPASQ
jgi:hypothetical protein